jgi:hypothetical protein
MGRHPERGIAKEGRRNLLWGAHHDGQQHDISAQSRGRRRLMIVVLRARSNRLADTIPLNLVEIKLPRFNDSRRNPDRRAVTSLLYCRFHDNPGILNAVASMPRWSIGLLTRRSSVILERLGRVGVIQIITLVHYQRGGGGPGAGGSGRARANARISIRGGQIGGRPAS